MGKIEVIGEFKPNYDNIAEIAENLTIGRGVEFLDEMVYPKTEDAIKSTFVTLYQHMIKYILQEEKQSHSWINSITRSIEELNLAKDKVGKSTWNKITPDVLKSAYKIARSRAAREIDIEERKISSNIPHDWLDIDLLLDEGKDNYIKNFLLSNQYTDEAKYVNKRMYISDYT